jgi:hypothetical protein
VVNSDGLACLHIFVNFYKEFLFTRCRFEELGLRLLCRLSGSFPHRGYETPE